VLFRTLPKSEFTSMMQQMLEAIEVIAPKQVGVNAKGESIHQFLPIQSVDQMDLEYSYTDLSAKSYFMPFEEVLSTFKFEGKDWSQEITYWSQPRAIVGLHACDINALLKMDKVFIKEFFPNPYYFARRNNAFIIGIDHDPCEGGFCRSLGTDSVTRGFDLFLTDLGDKYFVSVGSDKGFNTLQQVKNDEVTDKDTQEYLEKRRQFAKKEQPSINIKNLPNVLDMEFKSDFWKKWGDKCLSCGSCAMVCPTCYCYGITELASMDFKVSRKTKKLYSCNLLDFSLVAGGHNFRPERENRLRYRYYHQHRGFVESYGEPKCVGCNRCGRVCLAGINPKDIIQEIQTEVKE